MSRSAPSQTLVSSLPDSGPVPAGLPVENDVVLSKIRIERRLGEGAMAVVYAARHELLDLPVALKILHPDQACDEAVSRFFHEAKISARIKNEHVCGVLDVGILDDGSPYIMMELLEGMTVAELLAARGPLPVGEAVDLVLQALEGLSHAHAAGVVHRDLKPTNLFVAQSPRKPPTLKIIDFGISKSQMLEGFTMVGTFIGSPTYAAPEQITDPLTVDRRSDLWAIGVVLYELLSARAPFDGSSVEVVMARILREPPRPLWRKDVPRALEEVILRCLQKSRDDRFASAFEVAAALAPFASAPPAERLQRIAAATAGSEAASRPISVRPPPHQSGMRVLEGTTRMQTRSSPPSPPSSPTELASSPPLAEMRRWKILAVAAVAMLVYLAVVVLTIHLANRHSESDPGRRQPERLSTPMLRRG